MKKYRNNLKNQTSPNSPISSNCLDENLYAIERSSTQYFDLSYWKVFAEKIENEKCGGIITMNKKSYVCILRVPPLPYMCVLHPGTVILQNSRVLRELCDLSNCHMSIKWTCKIKNYWRLLLQFSLYKNVSKKRWNGIQSPQSQKVSRTFEVRTVPVRFFGSQDGFEIEVYNKRIDLAKMCKNCTDSTDK